DSWVRRTATAGSVGWLTLERGDAGMRFWAYLHAAISAAVAPEDEAPPELPVPAEVASDVFLARMANALAQRQSPVLVVFDEYHQVEDPEIAEGLDFLLRHAACQFRLVIATRGGPALPLHRWRLSGELTEIRADQLSFTTSESAQLLARHGLVLPEADLN